MSILYKDKALQANDVNRNMPSDWSFIQLGTTFKYNERSYEVVGRVRLQLRNDYKNLWSAVHPDSQVWLMESFASGAVLEDTWKVYGKPVSKLHAGSTFTVRAGIKLRGEYVEKCEGLSIEGEIGEWPLLQPGFFFIQGSNNDYQTAVFTVDAKQHIKSLQGMKADIDQLQLTNIVGWNEWK